jgi:hypothetical protein
MISNGYAMPFTSVQELTQSLLVDVLQKPYTKEVAKGGSGQGEPQDRSKCLKFLREQLSVPGGIDLLSLLQNAEAEKLPLEVLEEVLGAMKARGEILGSGNRFERRA